MSSPESLTDTRRADILRAALKCFAAKGFHATTMADIAKACKMSAGNLYNYFAGKVDIVEELARHEIERMQKNLQDFHFGSCAQEDMRTHIKQIALSRLESQGAKVSLEILSERTRSERMAQILHEFDSRWRDALVAVMSQHIAEPEESLRRRIELNLTLMDGLGARLVAHPELDREALADDVASFIIGNSR